MRVYLDWIDAQLDPGKGVGFWQFYWNYKLLLALHIAPLLLIAFVLDKFALAEPGTTLYYLFAISLVAVIVVVPVFLWIRRGMLQSRSPQAGVRSNGR